VNITLTRARSIVGAVHMGSSANVARISGGRRHLLLKSMLLYVFLEPYGLTDIATDTRILTIRGASRCWGLN
jgi:hypothetical protein